MLNKLISLFTIVEHWHCIIHAGGMPDGRQGDIAIALVSAKKDILSSEK